MAIDPKVSGARGGHARAKAMTKAERSEAARKAVQERWSLPREQNSGVLELVPGVPIACAVLSNGMRVLSTRGVSRAFGSKKTGTDNTGTGAPQPPPFLTSKSLSPFLSEQLIALLNSPVIYLPKVGGRTAYGYDHSVFPMICKAIIAADRAGVLKTQQLGMVKAADAMLDALVGVAMVALIDEATGYQQDRARDELQTILKAYVNDAMLPWLARFPAEFFKQTYRLMKWDYKPGSAKHPGYVGKIINECIYERLPEPVLPKLRELNPVINGNRRRKHHQHLTEDTGIPHLDKQIASVTTLMAAAVDRNAFDEMLVRAFPKVREQIPLGLSTL
jgi:hypothetical protein